jgi:hydroxyacylglutathione hydrolase
MNGADLARQLGALPPRGSGTEAGMVKVFNLRTRLKRRMVAAGPEPVADGVWLVRGGFPGKHCNVFLVRDGDGIAVFDAGSEAMTDAVAAAGATLGGITRVILGHAHPDHRGGAAHLGVPVLCHGDERADAEGDGGVHDFDLSKLRPYARPIYPRLLELWDGGPVKISGTLAEGDEVAGFEVVHLPGHAPGLIGLWRTDDRLALTSDCFLTIDEQTGRHGPPHVAHEAFNDDTERARASVRKLAALEPATAWPGHGEPVTGDVRGQLQRAADTT